ncbi:acyl-CoA dehydrogenase [Jiangella asiatica]|uniref:Acyl-CoA dehydrogenase n=2 Tax=Jiangella asiatica TaxID=2530372 RepID=A0A4R5CLD3_9ACTN|nr:acyl-CoA dehydrogenase [Jiangella asiatica]
MAAAHVGPIADAIDRGDAIPSGLVDTFADMGLVQLPVPVEYGGPGGDVMSAVIAREEIAAAGSMAAAQLANQNGTLAGAVARHGSDVLKAELLPDLATGRHLTAICMTEPEAGSDPSRMTTRAVRDAGDWVIDGLKSFISWGSQADFALVFARTSEAESGGGIGAFVVDTADQGWKVERVNDMMGARGVPNCDIRLDGLRVPARRMVGDQDGGFAAAMDAVQRNRPVVAAASVGCAVAAMSYAAEYARERYQSGRPIAQFQGIRWKLADMATRTEAARRLVYASAEAFDAGASRAETGRLASMAKLVASETAVDVTREAVQILGGHGYLRDHPVERYVRDAILGTLYEGTSEIQRNIIAKAVLP